MLRKNNSFPVAFCLSETVGLLLAKLRFYPLYSIFVQTSSLYTARRRGVTFAQTSTKVTKSALSPGKAERSKNYRFSLYLYLNSLPFPAHLCSGNKFLPIGNFHISTLCLTSALFRTSLFKTAFSVEWPLLYLCLYALYISHCFPLQFTPEPNP